MKSQDLAKLQVLGFYYFITYFSWLSTLHAQQAIVPVFMFILFADYYIRTLDTSIEHNQGIQKEKERIWSDFDFVKNKPTEDAFAERMAAYMKLSLPQV